MSGNVLSAGQAALVLFGVFVGLLVIRVPVAFALGLACLPVLLIEPHLSMMTLAQETFNAERTKIETDFNAFRQKCADTAYQQDDIDKVKKEREAAGKK